MSGWGRGASSAGWRRTFRLVVAFLGLSLALGSGELLLRAIVAWDWVRGPGTFSAFMKQAAEVPPGPRLFRKSEDPALYYELIPNSRRARIRINAQGFRGPEYEQTPPRGVTRIAVIGDSESFGQHLLARKTLAGSLETQLNASGREGRFQVLNFGVPGYNTAQEWRVLQTRVLPYQPSVVVLYYVLNDPEIQSRTLLLSSTRLSRSSLYMFSVWLLRFREMRIDEIRRQYRSIAPYYKALHHSSYGEASRQLIRTMGHWLHRRGIHLLLVIAPEICGYDDFSSYPYREVHADLAALASEEITVIDPLEDLAQLGKKPRSLWVTRTDPHKNAEATRAIARRVAEVVRGLK